MCPCTYVAICSLVMTITMPEILPLPPLGGASYVYVFYVKHHGDNGITVETNGQNKTRLLRRDKA